MVPEHCSVPLILHFLQSLLEKNRAAATLRVTSRTQPLSKQRLLHWVVEVITHTYTSNKYPVPLGVRCHSTRSISTSWAALKGVLLSDICAAATWSSTNTFARYYRVNVAASGNIGTAVLSGPSTSS